MVVSCACPSLPSDSAAFATQMLLQLANLYYPVPPQQSMLSLLDRPTRCATRLGPLCSLLPPSHRRGGRNGVVVLRVVTVPFLILIWNIHGADPNFDVTRWIEY